MIPSDSKTPIAESIVSDEASSPSLLIHSSARTTSMIVRREVVASRVHLICGTQCTIVNAILMRPTKMSAVRIRSSMTSRRIREGTQSRLKIKELGGCEDFE